MPRDYLASMLLRSGMPCRKMRWAAFASAITKKVQNRVTGCMGGWQDKSGSCHRPAQSAGWGVKNTQVGATRQHLCDLGRGEEKMKSEILYPGAFPMARVELTAGEAIKAESGAMVASSPTIDVESKMEGGFIGALSRRFLTGE